MFNRRAVLRGGLAVSLLSGLPRRGLHAAPAVGDDLLTVIVDRDLRGSAEVAASRRFARQAERIEIGHGDAGNVWMNVIEPALRVTPRPIGGYTRAATLFCLQYLARDHGLALVGYRPCEGARAGALFESLCAGPRRRAVECASELVDLRDPAVGDGGLAWLLAP